MTVILTGDDAARRQVTATVAAPRPLTDAARLRAVAGLLTDPNPLDDMDLTLLVAEVARSAGAQTVMVSLMLNDAAVTIAAAGLPEPLAEGGGLPVEWTPCGVVAGSDRPVAIGDLATDPVYRDTPLTLAFGLRAYAGVPLHNGCGLVVGTLAVLDSRPHAFGLPLLDRLTLDADNFTALLERRRR
ncbi:MAG: GAF domain-containing protein [Actinoplanes sp.]